MAEICITKGSMGNASETLVVEPTVNDKCPVAVGGRTIANDNVSNAVVEIERKPEPRAGSVVCCTDVVNDIIIHGLLRDQTLTEDKLSSELFVKSMMLFSDFIISKL